MARRAGDERCSFCGKKRGEVQRLIAGPGVFICDRCVALCSEIIKAPPPAPPAGGRASHQVKSEKPGWGPFRHWLRSEALQGS